MFPEKVIQSMLKENQLDTLTAFILGVLVETEADLNELGEPELELIGMALQHAGLHPDMEQEEFNDGLLRFMAACPPDQALLEELTRAMSE